MAGSKFPATPIGVWTMVANNPRDEIERRFLLMLAQVKIVDPFQLNQVLLRQAMNAGHVCYHTPERTRVVITKDGLERLEELGDK